MIKGTLDKVLERAVSRKLLVWITAAGFTYAGTVDSGDFVILSAIYIGSQGVIDAVSQDEGRLMSGYANLASSALSFAKKYWKELLIFFCVLALFAKMRGDYSSLVATFESATESHQEQMDKVKEIHEQELIARDELIKRYSGEISGFGVGSTPKTKKHS